MTKAKQGDTRTAQTLSDVSRRGFFMRVAAVATVPLAAGTMVVALTRAGNADEAVTDASRWGLFIDTTKCATGCDACVRGCNEEHGIESSARPEIDAQWIRKVVVEDTHTKHVTSLPLMCQHCADPPCVEVCPTGASFKRADGIVLVDKHTCIGCRYCMMACPYKARSFVHESLSNQKSYSPRGKGTVEGCTLCVHRLDEGQGRQPACVEGCLSDGHAAMVFGDLHDPDSDIALMMAANQTTEIRADLDLDTGVRYVGI
jgi:tetrathionate reductase subunit B